MIDIRKLKELVRLMVSNDLTEIDLRDSEEQVTLRRPSPLEAPQVNGVPVALIDPGPVTPNSSPAPAERPAAVEEGLTAIASPMVGTFYAQPDPDSPAFVKVGDAVAPDTVVCLVEAMKIFNEIKAEVSGTIATVSVKTGEAVEFGQPLFFVRPD